MGREMRVGVEYGRGCLGGVGSELNVAGVFGQGGGQT